MNGKSSGPIHRASQTKLILASNSPRRARVLRNAGFKFEVRVTQVDETPRSGETASAHVLRLACEKARSGAAAGPSKRTNRAALVIGADTIVVARGKILGKPRDVNDARRMLRLLSGKTHRVLTGVCLLRIPDRSQVACVESTRVHFLKLSGAQIDEYIATGEPFDKAGAYGIQGLAGSFIDRIDGCYFNVVGLPLSRVCSMLHKFGAPKF